jgi:Na+-translocating ferredoxin:NAD+ oxidoreductase RnfG subunit
VTVSAISSNASESVLPQGSTSETVLPEESTQQSNASESVLPQGSTSETVLPEESTQQSNASESVLPQGSTSETVLPEESTQQSNASESVLPQGSTSETVLPEESTQQSNASNSISPEQLTQSSKLLVTISPLKNPVARGDRQSATITVTDSNKMAVSDAQINGKLVYPGDNFEKDFEGATDLDGEFIYSWTIGKKGDEGVLIMEVEAISQGFPPTSANSSFEIVKSSDSSKFENPFQSDFERQ